MNALVFSDLPVELAKALLVGLPLVHTGRSEAVSPQYNTGDPTMTTTPTAMTRRPPRTIEVVLDHQLDANCYALDRTPESLRLAQHHMRVAARLIDGYLGGKAA